RADDKTPTCTSMSSSTVYGSRKRLRTASDTSALVQLVVSSVQDVLDDLAVKRDQRPDGQREHAQQRGPQVEQLVDVQLHALDVAFAIARADVPAGLAALAVQPRLAEHAARDRDLVVERRRLARHAELLHEARLLDQHGERLRDVVADVGERVAVEARLAQ